MNLLKLTSGDQYIIDRPLKLNPANPSFILDASKCHELYYRQVKVSDLEGVPEELKNTSQMTFEFGFTQMSSGPLFLEEIEFNRSAIAYLGKIAHDSRLSDVFARYKKEMNID
jgi:hypothetical protein